MTDSRTTTEKTADTELLAEIKASREHEDALERARTWFITPQEYDRLVLLENRWRDPTRILVAFRLAKDLDTCRDLLTGIPVHPSRIDQNALHEAKQTTYVQLVAPISILEPQIAA